MAILRTSCCLAVVLGMILVTEGCQPPPMVSAVPPGVDPRESLMPKEEPAEALGEGGATRKTVVLPGLVPAEPTARGEQKTTPSGVIYETLKEGTGATARAGKSIAVHYTGTLDDGRVFDSSRKNSKPFVVMIGTGGVIKGWDEAIPGMKVGEIRKLTIPPTAGYGALGQGEKVPPNATLHFEVELFRAD